VVLTHFHADHVDGLAGVLGGHEVATVLTSNAADPADTAGVVGRMAMAEGADLTVAQQGEVTRVGDLTWQVLGPPERPPGPGEQGSAANNASVVLLVEVAGVRILLTGDVEPEAQAAVARAAPGLRVDVLKVPHHGSRYQDVDWLLSLDPAIALVSVGEGNDYGHPARGVVDALGSGGADVQRTDTSGDLAVAVDDDGHLRLRSRG
ncbi:MAG: MBL fold metallo-hydrolase, partial [Nocardioides sp.]